MEPTLSATPLHAVPFAPTPKRRSLRQHLAANFLILVAIFTLLIWSIWATLPTITTQSFAMPQGVILKDRIGNELYRFYRSDDRINLPLEEFPDHLRNAVIAMEDKRFYERSCIDMRALGRAALANVFAYKSQGASTITQQLLRNTFDLREKTFSRKALELSLACKMESVTEKDDILSLYLNHSSFGGSTYGAQKASQTFFARDVREITLAQSAVLAALLQRPTYLSPYGPHKRSELDGQTVRLLKQGKMTTEEIPPDAITIGLIGRRYDSAHDDPLFIEGRANQVLNAMLKKHTIDQAAYNQAQQELLTLTFADPDYPVTTPYFPSLVQKEATTIPVVGRNCSLQADGCVITSTLDPYLQTIAEQLIEKHAASIQEKYGARHVSLVALDRNTRQIVAYIGNVDFSAETNGSRIDMAQTPRQPGSTFKPFVYATAFEKGYTPRSFVQDTPVSLAGMRPQNYEGGYHGWVSIRHALAGSRNIPAIRTFFLVGGEDPILEGAARAGVTHPLMRRTEMRQTLPQYGYGYPLSIGAAEAPLMQMIQGYATFANNGAYLPVTAIKEVRDGQNKVVYSAQDSRRPVQAMHPLIARQITSILSDNMFREGEYWKEALTLDGIDSAVKTGTSNQCIRVEPVTGTCLEQLPRDVWTIGYTPWFVVGVWAGNANNQALTPAADGLNVAAPLWKEFLQTAHAVYPTAPREFPESSTMSRFAVDGFYQPQTSGMAGRF
jgi:penicillin-binding protein 1A